MELFTEFGYSTTSEQSSLSISSITMSSASASPASASSASASPASASSASASSIAIQDDKLHVLLNLTEDESKTYRVVY